MRRETWLEPEPNISNISIYDVVNVQYTWGSKVLEYNNIGKCYDRDRAQGILGVTKTIAG